ncbi:zinc-ribbon domain-containing protein, partial [Methylophaga sp. UBA1918]
MKRFFCQCGQEIFFDNTHCGVCGSQLGFIP